MSHDQPSLIAKFTDEDDRKLKSLHKAITESGPFGVTILAQALGRATNGNPDGWTIEVGA